LIQIYISFDIIQCYGITQNPNTKEYIMVLDYCNNGDLRKFLNESVHYVDYGLKIDILQQISRGLINISSSSINIFPE
jgi:serine/threonine protein kinase